MAMKRLIIFTQVPNIETVYFNCRLDTVNSLSDHQQCRHVNFSLTYLLSLTLYVGEIMAQGPVLSTVLRQNRS